MNNPFHRAAIKAFRETLVAYGQLPKDVPADFDEVVYLEREFERRLEDQARAFDACKSGTEISMKTLQHEIMHAIAKFSRRLKLDGNFQEAERAFRDHMKPHFEIRLW